MKTKMPKRNEKRMELENIHKWKKNDNDDNDNNNIGSSDKKKWKVKKECENRIQKRHIAEL